MFSPQMGSYKKNIRVEAVLSLLKSYCKMLAECNLSSMKNKLRRQQITRCKRLRFASFKFGFAEILLQRER